MVPSGGAFQAGGGETSSPSQVCCAGLGSPPANAGLVSATPVLLPRGGLRPQPLDQLGCRAACPRELDVRALRELVRERIDLPRGRLRIRISDRSCLLGFHAPIGAE